MPSGSSLPVPRPPPRGSPARSSRPRFLFRACVAALPGGPPAVNGRGEGGGRAGGSGFGAREVPGAPSTPRAGESARVEPGQALLPASRTCRAPGRASRRRPPKEGPGRPGGAPISPRAAPPANQRRPAAGRAAAGEGSGRCAVVSFCARLSGLARPVRRSWRSAGRCRVCSRCSSVPPRRSFYGCGCAELRKKGGSSFKVEIRMQKVRTFS